VVGFGLVAIDPENTDRIWVGGVAGLFRSEDGGATWEQLGEVANVDSLVISLTVDRVYATADGHTYAWELDER